MLDREDLQAIAELMDKKLEPINPRLDGIDLRLHCMEEDIAQLKEDTEITRDAANSLLAWADKCQGIIQFPLPKVE